MKTIGIDIGTTTISMVILDGVNTTVLAQYSNTNNAWIETENEFEKLQDGGKIYEICLKMLAEIDFEEQLISGIGITGQMHGILYVDEEGNEVTPLYTWQDGRGNQSYDSDTSYASYATGITGYEMASGFGGLTHFYNTFNGLIPEEAVSFCTIADYVAMKLCDRKKPLLHKSMAASLGFYDIEGNCFDKNVEKLLNIKLSYFPKVAKKECFIGKNEAGVPIAIALGDNQASFLGSMGDGRRGNNKASCNENNENNKNNKNNKIPVLLNIGTGSQISIYCKELGNIGGGEYRPYIAGSYLWAGSPLCGGYSYQILKNFFEKTLELFGATVPDNIYKIVNEAGTELYQDKDRQNLLVDTRFKGSRSEPERTGGIANVTENTWTPEHLVLGFLTGIAKELHELYCKFADDTKVEIALYGSGNGLRKNPLLQAICEEMFKESLILPSLVEEAASGAGVLAAMLARDKIAREPIFFERNRVERVYDGGLLFGDFFGDERKDDKRPEEWIASTVKAINKNCATSSQEGLSVIKGTSLTLKELIEDYPKLVLGERKDLSILVKMLDSGIRLPLQAHPDSAFSKKYLHSEYGKTEMWYVVAIREGAYICFGFNRELIKEEFIKIIEASAKDKDVFEGILNKVYVKPGDVFLIPAKAVHAIGYGCLILEVQEPTDFTIQPEHWCGEYKMNDYEMYLGLSQQEALECFDLSLYGEHTVHLARMQPQTIIKDKGLHSEVLVGYEDTPCFAVRRHLIYGGGLTPTEGPAIYIVISGKGVLSGSDFEKELAKGDYFLLPQIASGKYIVSSFEGMELVECLPGQE